MEIASLRTRLEKAKDYKAEQVRSEPPAEFKPITNLKLSVCLNVVCLCVRIWKDELRARRNQESANREWRRKERELAAKKAHEEAMLKAAYLEQVRCKEHLLSIEAGREKAEFERVLK